MRTKYSQINEKFMIDFFKRTFDEKILKAHNRH